MTDIADLIGSKTSGTVSRIFGQLGIQPKPFEEARLKGILKKVRKYERRLFDGTHEDKAYILGLAHGDLSVSRPWMGAVRVSTSTTHPAMAKLFWNLFSTHGHVHQFARIKKEMRGYEWNLDVTLDDSFDFLLLDHKSAWEWVSQRETTLCAYLAGILDADGSVGTHPNAKVVSIRLTVYNTNMSLLGFVKQSLITLGYRPKGPYKEKDEGDRSSKFDIPHRKDYCRVALFDFDQSQSLLRRLPLIHREKVARKVLALSLARDTYWKDVSERVYALRRSFRLERDLFVAAAQLEVERRQYFAEKMESPPVLCTLQREALKRERKEHRDELLTEFSDSLAAHNSFLCWSREPCVILCPGSNAENIVRLLVHESVHHVLLWINGEGSEGETGPEDIVMWMEDGAMILDEDEW